MYVLLYFSKFWLLPIQKASRGEHVEVHRMVGDGCQRRLALSTERVTPIFWAAKNSRPDEEGFAYFKNKIDNLLLYLSHNLLSLNSFWELQHNGDPFHFGPTVHQGDSLVFIFCGHMAQVGDDSQTHVSKPGRRKPFWNEMTEVQYTVRLQFCLHESAVKCANVCQIVQAFCHQHQAD